MKPTTLKTDTTKPLQEVNEGECGTIDIGGVTHSIYCRDGVVITTDSDDDARKSRCYFNLDDDQGDIRVTVTESRPMEARDLRVGDAFVVDEGDGREAVCICIDDSDTGYIRVLRIRDNEVTRQHIAFRRTEVTLVDLTFDAEPVEEERAIMLDSCTGPFELQGYKGERIGHNSCHGLVNVRWLDACGDLSEECQLLPSGLTVTVREPATYDSWDDVNVGDVGLDTLEDSAAIFIGSHQCLWFSPDYCVYSAKGRLSTFRPARLTHVDYTPREEVCR